MPHLRKFRAKDFLLQARAWALMGDAHVELGEYHYVASYYEDAANYKPNRAFTPTYLAKAGLAHEANKNDKAALACYQRIVQKFPAALQYGDALKHAARLKAMHTEQQPAPAPKPTP